mmetsp:Transcript_16994/g.28731  ORF Transcript_16994/g.28731 Transcript_16994/m.28731 type:complete len:219 (-) Transcript_16994:37-693(-)
MMSALHSKRRKGKQLRNRRAGWTASPYRVYVHKNLGGVWYRQLVQSFERRLLVDPGAGVVLVVADALGEPQADLLLGALHRVRAVANVAADIDAEVTADGAGERVGGVGSAEQDASGLHRVLALPHHADDRARADVANEGGEEGLAGKVGVVLLREAPLHAAHLEGAQHEALLLEALDDVSHETALDAVGLDHNVSLLSGRHIVILLWRKWQHGDRGK